MNLPSDLSNLDYTNKNLKNKNLSNRFIINTVFDNANLSGANLERSVFYGCSFKGTNLTNANLKAANFFGANMTGVYLGDADIEDTIGNMREIKSALFDTFPITWITEPDGTYMVQFGCQKRPGDKWKNTSESINRVHPEGYEWFKKYKELMIEMVESSPAIPHSGTK